MDSRRAVKPNPGRRKLPPGPNPLPIIGNILELGQKPHQSLAKLSKVHGPLMRLKLGTMTTVVVSSPEIARIVLQKSDQVLSSRTHPDAIRALDHHELSVAWMPVDSQWRKLRKLCKEKMFSVQRLDANQGLRREKLRQLKDYVNGCCADGQAVDVGRAAFTTSLNLLSATLFSVDFAAFGSDSSQELRDVVSGIMAVVGRPNFSDYFPFLQLVDLQGIFRESTVYFKKCFAIFDAIIHQRLQGSDSMSKNDMLEALLDIKPQKRDLFVAGTDTTSSTVEWAMAELMRNPEILSKARTELRNVVGQNEEVQESDISRLPYLQAVVKETFRLHPTVPLLLPRKAVEDVEINGFIVPQNTQVLVNVWLSEREACGPNPDVFMPERFMETETDFHGQHFELLPFGGGRRICLGLPLAHRMVHLVLATLISNFDWKLEEGLKLEDVDMKEKFGLTLKKAIPLKALPLKVSNYFENQC
ncbi:UNVERIFIED_CONTAM: cytochrome [Sesamum angustifolium]|uniref:Cytochrome n=1 Tax=Sesamum angustifolium TaxID=2727405 RepID=A0AAW2INA4_9LAMI